VFSFSGAATDTVTSAHTVVDTTQPFTVGAFVQPSSTITSSTGEVAVSKSAVGSGSSAFTLGMSPSGNYEFCLRPSGSAPVCAIDPATAIPLTTEYIAGEWDPANQQIRLFEAGSTTAKASAWFSGTAESTGPLLIGTDFVGGTDANEWRGEISDPSLFPGIVDKAQEFHLSTASSL
jgi:Concanavalin A-like lectin/glucanases superfamily